MDIIETLKHIPITTYVFFGLFIAAAIVQIIFAVLEKEKLRRIEKCFCLFFLFMGAVFAVPTFPTLYVGILLSLIGDLLLIFKKRNIYFYVGSLCFALSHICYLISIILIVGAELSWYMYVVAFVLMIMFYLATTFLIAKRLTKSGFEQYTMMAYFSILFFNFIVMILSITVHPVYLFITAIGSLMFTISDSVIVYNKFYKPFKKAEFVVMSTYLLAQMLIVIGMILTLLK